MRVATSDESARDSVKGERRERRESVEGEHPVCPSRHLVTRSKIIIGRTKRRNIVLST